MKRCETCGLGARYDKNPRSIPARLWKWDIGWCPGWKPYIRSLPENERERIMEKYR
jgi:hypothetical protein